MFYRSPSKSVCADVIPFYENGTYYLFYLRDYRDIENEGEGCPWCLLTSKDLVHYEDHGPVLERGSEEDQDLYVFTGSVFKNEGKYYIFYTGHNPHLRKKGYPEQKILLAESDDLYHWKKVKDFSFEAPSFLEMHDFRDPFVFKDEEKGCFAMLIAAREKNTSPTNSKGITAIAYSKDLYHWEVSEKPFYAPHAFFTHECPDYFRIGDYWYLAFSEFTDKTLTTYRISKNPYGPWESLAVNSFDGHAFYAAKSAFTGTRRIMFGWNPIKNNEKDNGPWQWGGTIIPHELVQDPSDGTLYCKCPHEVLDAYSLKKEVKGKAVLGEVIEDKGSYSFKKEGLSILDLGNGETRMKFSCDFSILDKNGTFGIMLKADDDYSSYYSIKFEPRMNRLGFDRLPRYNGFLHTEVDVERYCPLEEKAKHTLTLILEGSVLEVFVDDKYAMSARLFDKENGHISLFSQDEKVVLSSLSMSLLGDEQ